MGTKEVQVDSTPRLFCSFRLVWSLIAFFGYCILYMQRVNMGIAIVAMINNTALQQQQQQINALKNANPMEIRDRLNNSFEKYHLVRRSDQPVAAARMVEPQVFRMEANLSSFESQEHCRFTVAHGKSSDGPFVWDKKVQGIILSSFFYGYILTQIPGGYLSTRFGGKYVFGTALLLGSVFTLLAPLAARWDYRALIACRFLTGFFQGAAYPSMSSVWASWAPATERSRLIGLANSGSIIGSIVGLPLGGYMATLHHLDGGWPLIFYTFGGIGIVWFAFLLLLTSNTPSNHRFISARERDYILQTTKKSATRARTPWVKIVTSKVCIGIVITHICFNWGNYLFLTQLPSFLKDVLKFDIKSNGAISSLPYIASWVIIMVSSVIADCLIASNKLSRTTVRKLFNGIGFLIPLLALVGLSFVKCSTPYTGVALLVIGVAFTGCSWGAGFFVNLNEVCGEFSGIFFGIANTFGTIPGIVAPYLVGVLTPNQTQEEWRIVFWITGAVYLVGFAVYTLFSKAELQDWAVTNPDSSSSSSSSSDESKTSKETI